MAEFTVAVKGLREVVRSLNQYEGAIQDLKRLTTLLVQRLHKLPLLLLLKHQVHLLHLLKQTKQNRRFKSGQVERRFHMQVFRNMDGAARNIKAQPFLRRAAWTNREYTRTQYVANLNAIRRKYIGGN